MQHIFSVWTYGGHGQLDAWNGDIIKSHASVSGRSVWLQDIVAANSFSDPQVSHCRCRVLVISGHMVCYICRTDGDADVFLEKEKNFKKLLIFYDQ